MVPPSLVFLHIWPQHLSPFLTEDLWCSAKFNSYTASPLQANFQTFKDINVRVQAQLRELALVSSAHGHVRTSSTRGRACVRFTARRHTGCSGAQLTLLQACGVWEQDGRQDCLQPRTGTCAGSSKPRGAWVTSPCAPTPAAGDPSALPYPSFPSSSSFRPFTWCQPWHTPAILPYCKIKSVYLLFVFLYTACVRSITNLLQCSPM